VESAISRSLDGFKSKRGRHPFAAWQRRTIIKPVANIFEDKTDKSIHSTIKPVPVLQHFFQMIVDEYTNMLDPTCGSGTALRAAETLGASRMLGLEWNESFAADARNALLVARRRRSSASAQVAARGPQAATPLPRRREA
jgi:hypothetical protein